MRRLLVAQAAGMLAGIALSTHGLIDRWLHPNGCAHCLVDFRGFDLFAWLVFLGVPVLVVGVAAWLTPRHRRWPAALAIVVDVWVLGVIASSALGHGGVNPDQAGEPILGIQLVLAVAPALATLGIGTVMLTRKQ